MSDAQNWTTVSDWSDLPDVYVTKVEKADRVVWRVEACSVPMAIGPEIRLAPADTRDALIRELVSALKVFSACADELDLDTMDSGREYPDDEWAKFRLLVSDYRTARNAIRKAEEAGYGAE